MGRVNLELPSTEYKVKVGLSIPFSGQFDFDAEEIDFAFIN